MQTDSRLQGLEPDAALLRLTDVVSDVRHQSMSNRRVLGQYEINRFVMRLTPKIHDLIESAGEGRKNVDQVGTEAIQAYSTFIHETIHWWQHVGSTSGLLRSLSFPGQTLASLRHLKQVLGEFQPQKSLKTWTDNILSQEGELAQEKLASANAAVNNALDVEYYKLYAIDPRGQAEWLLRQKHFESVGHGYRIAYGHLLTMVSETVDLNSSVLPTLEGWDDQFSKLADEKVDGFYCGSDVVVSPIGLLAVYEGQAIFNQLQYLSNTHKSAPSCQQWRELGLLHGVYIEAFEQFLKVIDSQWPETVDDPLVNLFLLICDVAINPTAGFPFEVKEYKQFIFDVDVGLRFVRLCSAIRGLPHLRTSILNRNQEEYLNAVREICDQSGDRNPVDAFEAVAEWPRHSERVRALMEEHRTFRYSAPNYAVRVLISHFISFSSDKAKHPDFFCWPGSKLAGRDLSQRETDLWGAHLTLFTDRADKRGIFPRKWPEREESATLEMLEAFFSSIVLFDLTKQWILEDGPFRIDVDWIFENAPDDETAARWANDIFASVFCCNLGDFNFRGAPPD